MAETVWQEWVAKAEADWRACLALAPLENQTEIVYFHAQQCLEKLMKARLIQREAPVPRTHNLVRLANELEQLEAATLWDKAVLAHISFGAVDWRYPGDNAEDLGTAKEVLAMAEPIRDQLLLNLGT